jgi:hypothetical protein
MLPAGPSHIKRMVNRPDAFVCCSALAVGCSAARLRTRALTLVSAKLSRCPSRADGADVGSLAVIVSSCISPILALPWDQDIGRDWAMIGVTRNVEETDKYGRRIMTPKSKRGVRESQIDASLVALLRQVRASALQLVAGVPDARRSAKEIAKNNCYDQGGRGLTV